MKVLDEVLKDIQCPVNKCSVLLKNNKLVSELDVNLEYKIHKDIPIIINEKNSLFNQKDILSDKNELLETNISFPKKFLLKILPNLSKNLKVNKNLKLLSNKLPNLSKILIIGGSIRRDGMEHIYFNNKNFKIISTDVFYTSQVNVINDAHDLCFKNETFDCVIVQAVLEHVLEPQRCVDEIYRVLKNTGYVYAETAFMQGVHMKEYDFTRFTALGHRYLFKKFEKIKAGPCCGPGMSLAWSYMNFLKSFTSSDIIRKIIIFFARLTGFFFKYFDYLIIDNKGSYDNASAFYFLGKKSNKQIEKKELLKEYIGF